MKMKRFVLFLCGLFMVLYTVSIGDAASDTCTYSGSGVWNIDCSDNCVISGANDLGGESILAEGSGTVTFETMPDDYVVLSIALACTVVIGE